VHFFLQDSIVLVTENCVQMFRNPRKSTYKALPRLFPDISKIYDSAECYTEGVTNKDKFLRRLDDLEFIKSHNITEDQKRFLYEFIRRSDLPPPAIRQQLYMRKLSHIADAIDFSDHKPELIATCEIFWNFIEAIREKNL